jgi:hypothetical protein
MQYAKSTIKIEISHLAGETGKQGVSRPPSLLAYNITFLLVLIQSEINTYRHPREVGCYANNIMAGVVCFIQLSSQSSNWPATTFKPLFGLV